MTDPETGFTVATEVLLLDHVPPLVPFEVKVVESPLHIVAAPVIEPAFATALTVIN